MVAEQASAQVEEEPQVEVKGAFVPVEARTQEVRHPLCAAVVQRHVEEGRVERGP